MFTKLAQKASALAARPAAAAIAALLFVAWGVAVLAGRDTLAAVIAGGATVATVTIVFLLQHSQYHDSRALHAKIDELILGLEGPRDELAGIERRAADELAELRGDADESSAATG